MAKQKPTFRMRSYGIYSQWDSSAKELPDLQNVTTDIPAEIDIEFGFIINVVGGKNRELHFCIDHPGILDTDGNRRPPFDGTVYIKKNDWDFYLGDTIWLPIADKLGSWRMFVELDGKVVAEKTFSVTRM